MGHEEERERIWRALAQGEMPWEDDLPALSDLDAEALERTAALWTTAPADVRRRVAHTLAVIAALADRYSFLDLFRMMLNDPDPKVIEAALHGLIEEEADDYRLIEPLVQLLRSADASVVRAAAARALAHFIALGAEGRLSQKRYRQAREALLAAHRDAGESVEVRRRALEAVAGAGGETIAALIEAAYRDKAPAMRISALYAMGDHGDQKRWQRTVLRELHNTDPEMRYEAAVASGKLDLAKAIPALIELTDDVDDDVRKAAILALGEIAATDRAREVLVALLEDEDPAIRELAEEALAHFDLARIDAPPVELPALFPSAEDES